MTDIPEPSRPAEAALPLSASGATAQEPAAHPALARTGLSVLSRPEIENIDRQLPFLSYSAGRLTIGGSPAARLWDSVCPMLLYLPEIASDPEWRIARRAGFPPERTVANGVGRFIAWFPIAGGELAGPGALEAAGVAGNTTAAQVALAWLLRRSPVMLLIPGTASAAHLEENVAAAAVQLSDEQYQRLLAAT